MSTVAQVRKVAAPLLRNNPDLALVGRFVVLKPVTHILRFVILDNTSGKDAFRPRWAVAPFFHFDAAIALQWGEHLYSEKSVTWSTTADDVDLALLEQCEEKALPALRAIRSVDDFFAFASKPPPLVTPLRQFPVQTIYVAAARGDRDTALAQCAHFKTEKIIRWYEVLKMQPNLDVIRNRVYPLILSGDIAGIAAFLHEMEAAAVRRLKLEKVWQRTTFPIEEHGWI